ncbi:MAG: DUF4179 domain-containing protein [Marinirhabdus sp.]
MKNNTLDNKFEALQGCFDVAETPPGHQNRFAVRLQRAKRQARKGRKWSTPLYVAAAVVVLLAVGLQLFTPQGQTAGLATVSPEMETTENYFLTTIAHELQNLAAENDPTVQAIVNDALQHIELLETDYEQLRTDLVKSGYNKRVVHGMIANLQTRMQLLKQVSQKVEEIKQFKTQNNETLL